MFDFNAQRLCFKESSYLAPRLEKANFSCCYCYLSLKSMHLVFKWFYMCARTPETAEAIQLDKSYANKNSITIMCEIKEREKSVGVKTLSCCFIIDFLLNNC